MSAFPGSSRVLKGGIVFLDADEFTVLPHDMIVLTDRLETADPNAVQCGIFPSLGVERLTYRARPVVQKQLQCVPTARAVSGEGLLLPGVGLYVAYAPG